MSFLDNISVLLIETQSPGNIGSVARAMKNMGLRHLVLVNCQTELTEETYQLACGADDILSNSQPFASLKEALSSFNLSVGTSSRSVQWIPTVYRPRQLAEKAAQLPGNQRIALVFGPERTGLTNEHLRLCQWLVTIPTNADFPSVNLAQAVTIIAYELRQQVDVAQLGRAMERASIHQVEAFFKQLEQCLIRIGFLHEQDPKRIMATLRQIMARASLEGRDVRILRGILRQWGWYREQLETKGLAPKK